MTNDRTAMVAQAIRDGALLGVREGALLIENSAKENSPVRTGNLRRSIHTEVSESPDEITATVGPSADYGIYVEFGTRKMAAQPYMRPAFEANRANVAERIKANIATSIRSALGGR